MADEREYIIPYSDDCLKRHLHRTEKGRVVIFMVQLEVKTRGEWRPAVRYDCAHGFAHRDSYNIKGEQRKETIKVSFEDALTLADDDIDDNWEVYREKFLRGEYP